MSNAYDVVIIGGGMIGLSLALSLAQSHFSVAVVESQAEPLKAKLNSKYSAQVSALHLGTYYFLRQIGVWPVIRSKCCSPFERIRVWGATGGRIDFDAAEVPYDVLGYVVENQELLRVLWSQSAQHSAIDLLTGVRPTRVKNRFLHLNQGQIIQAQLLVGADGAHSWLRQQMAVDFTERPYHHHALCAVVVAEKPHGLTAYQAFLREGILGVLPLSDPYRLVVVWSTTIDRIEALESMDLSAFNQALFSATNAALGHLHCLFRSKSVPLVERCAKQYIAGRCALIGDAAHTVHPLAGQGANLGFMDAACLAYILSAGRKGASCTIDHGMLRRYERWRKSENQWMSLMMRGLKKVFCSRNSFVVSWRNRGLDVVNQCPWIKRFFMQYAAHEQLPFVKGFEQGVKRSIDD